MLPSALIGGGLIALGARHIRDDMAMVVEDLREESDERTRMQQPDAIVPVLQVRNLDFSYGKVQVLFDIGFDVHEGETLALLGTNGAGKSTLLRVISGLGVARTRRRPPARPHDHLRRPGAAGPGRSRAAHRRRRDVRPADACARTCEMAAFLYDRKEQARRIAKSLELFPMLAGALRHRGRRPVRRPAADAGAGHDAGARARAAHHRRALARPGAGRRAAGARGRPDDSGTPASR